MDERHTVIVLPENRNLQIITGENLLEVYAKKVWPPRPPVGVRAPAESAKCWWTGQKHLLAKQRSIGT